MGKPAASGSPASGSPATAGSASTGPASRPVGHVSTGSGSTGSGASGPVPNPAATGLVMALLSAVTFGVSGPFGKALLEAGWSSGAATIVRVAGAAVVLLIPVLWMLRGRWRQLRSGSGTLTIYGLVAIAGVQLCFFNAVQYLSVGVALLLEFLAPVLIVGWIWLRTRRAPLPLTLAGSVLAVVGLVLVLDLTGSRDVDPVGVLWGLGAAVCLMVFFMMSAKVDESLPPVVMTGAGLLIGSAALLLLSATGLLPITITTGDVTLAGTTVSWLVPVAGLVLVSTVAAYLTGIVAAQKLGSQMASFVGLTEVLFAVLAAWLMLGELPSLIQLGGGVLIVAGVMLVRYAELRPNMKLARARAARQ